jgi:predicted nucleic acid-binding protein
MSDQPPFGPPIIDSNIFLRHVLNDVPDQSARARSMFAQIELGSESFQTTGTVVFECVYVLQANYDVPRDRIREALLPLLQLKHLALPEREIYPDVFELYVGRRGLSFADCYHAILAREHCTGVIISFDRGFDRVPGLTRLEPSFPA